MSEDNSYSKRWQRDGAVHVPGLLKPECLPELRKMAEWCLSRWNLHNPETGKPGLTEDLDNIFHINRPEYFESRPDLLRLLLETAAHPDILRILAEILGSPPIFRHTTLWKNPLDKNADGSWHRDSQFLTKTELEEKKLIENANTTSFRSIQVQIALVSNDDVEVVPGSHLRWDSDEEYRIRRQDDYRNSSSHDMPGAFRIAMKPGDAAFFSSFGLHRGRYLQDNYRRTLMFTYGQLGNELRHEYFTNQPWFLTENYLVGLSPEACAFYQHFIDTHKDDWIEWEKQGVKIVL
jgi:hypothetical protein